MLDLSHNPLSDSSYSSLSRTHHNYGEVTGLILSHNQLTGIHTKLTKLRLHRVFKADHNQITDIPYDFSLLLQSYGKTKITLGHNKWVCECTAEINNLVTSSQYSFSQNITFSRTCWLRWLTMKMLLAVMDQVLRKLWDKWYYFLSQFCTSIMLFFNCISGISP
jgi:Leucine-rich repeat (LRR) protein